MFRASNESSKPAHTPQSRESPATQTTAFRALCRPRAGPQAPVTAPTASTPLPHTLYTKKSHQNDTGKARKWPRETGGGEGTRLHVPRPRMCECAPMRSMRNTSLTSATRTSALPPAAAPAPAPLMAVGGENGGSGGSERLWQVLLPIFRLGDFQPQSFQLFRNVLDRVTLQQRTR